MPVGIDDINLWITGGRLGFDLHLTEIVIIRVFAVAFATQELEGASVSRDPHRKMNIAGIYAFAGRAESSVIMHDEMEMLSFANLEPGARKRKRRPGDFFQTQDLAIELLGPIQIR